MVKSVLSPLAYEWPCLKCIFNLVLKNIRHASCKQDNLKCPTVKVHTSPCSDNKTTKALVKPPAKEEFKSMWETMKCDLSVAKCPEIRFDTLYYKPSDKVRRKYQQTWIECPERLIKPKVVCEYPKDKYPIIEKRTKKDRPETAKSMSKSDLMDCSNGKKAQNKACLQVALPGCRGVRSDVRCKITRAPVDCDRPPNPFPSLSECTKPKIKPRRPSECECLKLRSMCEVWTILRQKSDMN